MLKANFEPIIASDGAALLLLKKEFPRVKSYTLPSYAIRYSKDKKFFKWTLLLNTPRILGAVKKEKKVIEKIVTQEGISGIISDNRFGCFHKKIPSVYITHQLNVFSGKTTFFTSWVHQYIIKNFKECWIPDYSNNYLSGGLSRYHTAEIDIKFIGLLSRFTFQRIKKKYDLLVLLSGPEPQRTILEKKVLKELKSFTGNVFFVRGCLDTNVEIKASKNINIVNYLLADGLEQVINESELVVARSGYSTIMDLAATGKKAFFIPTPGQAEQEYLAKRMDEHMVAPFANQEEFTIEHLKKVNNYKGFKKETISINLKLLELFQSE